MDLIDELLNIARALNENKIEYALCGGLAMAVHGYPRFTKDLDFLIKAQDIEWVKKIVAELGFILPSQSMTFRAKTPLEARMHRVSKAAGEDLIMIDLIQVEPGWGEVWQARQKFGFKGLPIYAVSLEGLISMKERAARPQDLVDLDILRRKGDDGQAG